MKYSFAKLSQMTLTLGFMAALPVLMSSCGDDSEDPSYHTLTSRQDVRLINYRLIDAFFQPDIQYLSGKHETLQKSLHFSNDSKDQVKRVIENANYVLVVNGKNAGLAMDSGGMINDNKLIHQDEQDCQIQGRSTIRGQATNQKIELNWDLDAALSGKGCADQAKADFMNFIATQVDRTNLQVVRNLLASTDGTQDLMKHIHLRLKITGVGI